MVKACNRSVFLYCSQVWSPSISNLRKLEAFHKKLIIWSSGHTDYVLGLTFLSALPICYQIILNDVLYFSKLLNNFYDIDVFEFVSIKSSKPGLRSCSKVLFTSRFSRKFSTSRGYFYRVVESVNYITNNTSINIFDSPERIKPKLKLFFTKLTSEKFLQNNSCTWYLSCKCVTCRS